MDNYKNLKRNARINGIEIEEKNRNGEYSKKK